MADHPEFTEPGARNRLNIHQRLLEVRRCVEYVRKTETVKTKGGTYLGVSHDEVTALVHKPFVEFGICTTISVMPHSVNIREVGQSHSGTPRFRYEANWQITFINVDSYVDGQGYIDQFSVIMPAHGDDFGDKAPGKACSMAFKYALLKVLNLETGENEESRVEVQERARKINHEEAQKLRDLLFEYGSDEEEFLGYLNSDPMVNLKVLEDMQIGVYEWAVRFLENKVAEGHQSPKGPDTQE